MFPPATNLETIRPHGELVAGPEHSKMPNLNLLEISIPTPCPASWDQMRGDDRVRFCSQCKLKVYNLSEMTKSEAEKLIWEKEGKLCARLFRRNDGTIITRECPQSAAQQ